MERIPFPEGLAKYADFFNRIFDSATEAPIILSTAPTTANGILKEGQRGQYGTKLYEMVNGTVYEYGTQV